jgi:NADH dehydrogenase
MDRDRRPHVVILGGGFGGLYAAKALERKPVRVTIIDRRNHHLFQPLLYQVATAALNPGDIAAPIRGVVGHKGQRVLLGEVTDIDLDEKRVVLADGTVPYDYLIVATGATHSYFGHNEWAPFAPGLKTIEGALDIRRRVLTAFEQAEKESDPEVKEALLTFVIVGAGATGVEMAGALSEISEYALAGDFQNIDPRNARVLLLEGAKHVLPTYPPELSSAARRSLERCGIEVRTETMVTHVDRNGVEVGKSERIPSRTVIWAAGVAASPVGKLLCAPLDNAGRVKVTRYLTVPDHKDVFVVGDLAHVEEDGSLVPGVAPAAMQMGRAAAKNILYQIRDEPMVPFSYWDRGMFSVIGRGAAVGVAFKKLQMKGPLAWFAWLFIHLVFLIGFRSKLVVMLNWAYAYLTSGRAIRLITESPQVRRQERERDEELEPEICPDGPDRAHETEAGAHA